MTATVAPAFQAPHLHAIAALPQEAVPAQAMNFSTLFCQAITKKGTPCTRKGPYCWQHRQTVIIPVGEEEFEHQTHDINVEATSHLEDRPDQHMTSTTPALTISMPAPRTARRHALTTPEIPLIDLGLMDDPANSDYLSSPPSSPATSESSDGGWNFSYKKYMPKHNLCNASHAGTRHVTSTAPTIPLTSKPRMPHQEEALPVLSTLPAVPPATSVDSRMREAIRLWHHTAQQSDAHLAQLLESLQVYDYGFEGFKSAKHTGSDCSIMWLEARRQEESALGKVLNMIVAHRQGRKEMGEE